MVHQVCPGDNELFTPKVKLECSMGYLQKDSINKNICSLILGTVAAITLLGWRIANKDSFESSKVKFTSVVSMSINKGSTFKGFQEIIFEKVMIFLCTARTDKGRVKCRVQLCRWFYKVGIAPTSIVGHSL